jgi:tetratricopeptide (TPR) repeat protein
MRRLPALTLSFVLLFSLFVSSSAQQKLPEGLVIPKLEKEVDPYRRDVDLARELIRVGKPGEAVQMIEQMKAVYGERQELRELLKDAYLVAKEYDRVEALIREDLERATVPNKWQYYIQLGNVYLKTDREEEAKLNFDQAVETAKRPDNAYREVARVYLRNQLTSKAIETYLQGRMKLGDPRAFSFDLAGLYEALFNYKEAIDEYFIFMGTDSTKFDLVADRINQLIRSEQNTEEIELALSERIRKNPKDRFSQKLHADLLFSKGDLSGSFESYKKVDELFKAGGRFIIEFVRMCINKRYFDQAIESCRYLLSTKPADDVIVDAKLLIATSQEGQEKYTEAVSTYQEVIDGYPESFPEVVGLCHFRIGEINLYWFEKPDEAFARYQTVVSGYVKSDVYPAALVRRGDCKMVKGELDSAQYYLEKALRDSRVEPKLEEVHFKLTEIKFFEGNFEAALQGYSRIVADHPKGFYVNNSLERIIMIGENQELDRPLLAVFAKALLEKLQGDEESAISTLDKVISAKSEKLSHLAQLEKGRIYREEKKFSESIKAFEKLLKEYPESYFCAQAQKLIGDVYYQDLNDNAKAVEAYQKLLKDYERSVYVDETRDKLRELQAEVSPTSSG